MTVVDTLTARNAEFAGTRFVPGLPMLPRLRTLVVGCVDPRVDPAHVLGLETGDAGVIRNVGGRVTPDVLAELALLARLARTLVGAAPVIDLIVMQHTDCGITRLQDPPDMLADFLHVDPAALPDKHVADPRAAVASDIAVLRSAPQIAASFRLTGVVYDVDTGRIDIVHSEVREPA
jgi:carbonic anhydrase